MVSFMSVIHQGSCFDVDADVVDLVIKNDNDDRSQAATKNPHLKLLFRLLNFAITDQSAFLYLFIYF